MTNLFGIFSWFLIISPAFSYVVFREHPVIYSNSEGVDLFDEYPITDKSPSIETHRQKIPRKDEKATQIQPITLSDLTTYLGLNENLFGGSKSLARELQALLTGKNQNVRTGSSSSSQSSPSTGTVDKSDENELEDLTSNESTSVRANTNQEPLNFGEVLTLLAIWHLANAFNDYAMEDQKQEITTSSPKKSKLYNE